MAGCSSQPKPAYSGRPMVMHQSRLSTLLIDVSSDRASDAAAFWSAALGVPGGQTLVRMTHRHLAIFRTRVKPYRAYNSSGPVCR
jgi:hypothetical protein